MGAGQRLMRLSRHVQVVPGLGHCRRELGELPLLGLEQLGDELKIVAEVALDGRTGDRAAPHLLGLLRHRDHARVQLTLGLRECPMGLGRRSELGSGLEDGFGEGGELALLCLQQLGDRPEVLADVVGGDRPVAGLTGFVGRRRLRTRAGVGLRCRTGDRRLVRRPGGRRRTLRATGAQAQKGRFGDRVHACGADQRVRRSIEIGQLEHRAPGHAPSALRACLEPVEMVGVGLQHEPDRSDLEDRLP